MRAPAGLLTFALSGLAAVLAQAPSTGSEELLPAVRVESVEGATRWAIQVPGTLVAYALPRSKGRREVWLLVERQAHAQPEAEAERSKDEKKGSEKEARAPLPPCAEDDTAADSNRFAVYRLSLAEPAQVATVLEGLPAYAALLAADLEGDGEDEVLLARSGELLRLDARRAPPVLERLLVGPELMLEAARLHSDRDAGSVDLPLFSAALGRLTLYGPRETGVWEALSRVDLPLSAANTGSTLQVVSPLPVPLGRSTGGSLVFATAPRRVGSQRLTSTVIEVAPGGEAIVTESWARLPDPERLLEHHFLFDRGQPMLFVTTMSSDKLSLFGEKRIRLYALERDRSRLGLAPRFAATSRMNLWQESSPLLRDVDGDGRVDLVVGYWKGLMDSRAVLDAYLGKPDGSFAASPKTTAFDVEDGDRSYLHYGTDLDGDGLADLLLRGDEGFQWHAGLASTGGKNLVASAARRLPSGQGAGQVTMTMAVSAGGDMTATTTHDGHDPSFADLDGDGMVEILASSRGDERSRGVLSIVWLREPPVGDLGSLLGDRRGSPGSGHRGGQD